MGKAPKIASLEDFDSALVRLIELRQELNEINAKTTKEVTRLQSKVTPQIEQVQLAAGKVAQPLEDEISRIEESMFKYQKQNHRQIYQETQSYKLQFGTIGCLQSTSIEFEDNKTTVRKLERIGRDDAVKYEKTVKKNVLQGFTDSLLRKVEAFRQVKRKFYYSLKGDTAKFTIGEIVE